MWHNKDVPIENFTLPTFRARARSLMGELAYIILTDRTNAEEERLGQWPPERGALPETEADANVSQLWSWLVASVDDAMLLHRGTGRFRLRFYGTKGHDTLANFTVLAKPDLALDDEPDQADDDLDVAMPASAAAPSVDNVERASQIVLGAVERLMRLHERTAAMHIRSQERMHASWEGQHAQMADQLQAARQQLQDVLDVLIAARLEAGETTPTRRGGREARPPNPLAAEALKQLGEAVRTFAGGANVPEAARKLLDHPKARDILSNPKLGAVLERNPGMADTLFDYLGSILSADEAGAGAAPDLDDFDIPDPGAHAP